MIAFLLTVVLNGTPVTKPIVLHSETECSELGNRLVDIVKETEPLRGNAMTFSCLSVLEATK